MPVLRLDMAGSAVRYDFQQQLTPSQVSPIIIERAEPRAQPPTQMQPSLQQAVASDMHKQAFIAIVSRLWLLL